MFADPSQKYAVSDDEQLAVLPGNTASSPVTAGGGGGARATAEGMVRAGFEGSLELRPELRIQGMPEDISLSTEKYREKARRLLEHKLSQNDVDLSKNWAVSCTHAPARLSHARTCDAASA